MHDKRIYINVINIMLPSVIQRNKGTNKINDMQTM